MDTKPLTASAVNSSRICRISFVIRVPLDGKIGDRIELDRKTAVEIMAELVIAAMFMRKA